MVILIDIVRRYQNHKGQDHRLEGPALFWSDGSFRWCFNGVKYYNPVEHPFNIFRSEYNLPEKYDNWPTNMKTLFKLTYGGDI